MYVSSNVVSSLPLKWQDSQTRLAYSARVGKINNVFSIADDLEGYVHLLSKVTASKNSKVTFFDCHIQTDENTKVRAVCYSPEKRINIQQAYKNKSPVKISGVKASVTKRFNAGLDEYTITKKAKIMPSSPKFEYNEALSSNLCTVKAALSKDLYEVVDLKVKVIKKQETKQSIVKNEKTSCKSDCLVADQTDSIKLVLWENHIDGIRAGKSYHIRNLKVRIFDDEKYLNTNESTEYSEIEEVEGINFDAPQIKENLLTGQCVAIQLNRTSCCLICNKGINLPIAAEEMVTCSSCNNDMLVEMLKAKLVAQLTIRSNDQELLKFTCFNDGLQSLLNVCGSKMQVDDMPLQDLKRIILKSGSCKIIADKATQVISQFLPL